MAKLSVERTLRKAISHERNGQMDEARKCYDSILELFPGNIRAKQGLAKLSQPKLDTLAGGNPSDEILHQLLALYNKGVPAIISALEPARSSVQSSGQTRGGYRCLQQRTFNQA